MQIKVHPLFFVLALLLVAFGKATAFIWTFLALILHELGHIFAARSRGFVVKKLVLLPFGAMMSTEENFDRASSVFIGLAGPAVNLISSLIILGIWWLAPAVYSFTETFFWANLTLGIFNLLPAYPLDGSRVVLGFAKNRLKAIKWLQIAGIAASLAFLALFIASAFYEINFSVGIISVFLFYGAAFATKDEMYLSVMDSASKNYELGVEKKRVVISGDTPIIRLYHHISSSCETVFEIADGTGRTKFTLTEQDLKALALKNKLSVSVKDAYLNKDGSIGDIGPSGNPFAKKGMERPPKPRAIGNKIRNAARKLGAADFGIYSHGKRLFPKKSE